MKKRPLTNNPVYPEITLEDNTLTIARPKIKGFSRYLKPAPPRGKLFYQVVASLAILALVLLVTQSESKTGRSVANGVKYVMTKEMNIKPYAQKFTAFMADAGLFDWPSTNAWKEEKVAPVSGDNKTGENNTAAKMALPVSGEITASYGWSEGDEKTLSRFHEGIDIAAKLGTQVKAPMAGKVTKTGEDKEFGKYIIVEHAGSLITFYGHCSEVLVKSGQEVKDGAVLAKVGKSGLAEEPVLHFEVREKGIAQNPVNYLNMQ